MNRKHQVFAFLGLAIVALTSCLPTGFTAVSVGVKKGDWTEYNVAFTGDVSEGHNVVWARMEVTDVQGANVTVRIDSRNVDGTQENSTATLDLEKGILGDQFIIPANLNVGDTFFDSNVGNVRISGSVNQVVAGVERTLITNTTYNIINNTTYPRSSYWDKSTGILIEGNYTAPLGEFTMMTTLSKTNMWSPDNTVYVLLAVALVLVGVVVVVFAIRRRKKPDSTPLDTKNSVAEAPKPA